MPTAAVILAAGASRRLGRPKQLLPYRGRPLLRAVATEVCASRCDGVAVVVRGGDPDVDACLDGLPVRLLANPGCAEGIASSIRVGVAWADREAYDGVVLLLSDQPALTAHHVDVLAGACGAEVAVVASRYGGELGVPALFVRALFPALLALRGECGAKALIGRA
ncbi:MAG TPA: nucleotidyltransferase family protein, partial [Polyangiaceae bacterium]|nr:nucleotidyltransferase family protein [Polyangiaceae bacterium]